VAQAPQQQLPLVQGVGGHPLRATGVDHGPAVAQRCISLGTKGGLKPANITEVFAMYTACANMLLLEAVVKNGGGSARYDALRTVIPALGSSFASPGVLQGATRFGPGRHNGPSLADEWGYVSACSCFRYVGKAGAMR
jgi:hypothetical protein